MAQLPALNARKVMQALRKAGFIVDRQKGSHCVMIHSRTHARTIIPIHPGKTIKKPLLKGILDDAQLSTESFLKLF